MSVVALVAYRPGTRPIFEACVESVFRHTRREMLDFRVIHDEKHVLDIGDLMSKYGISASGYPVPEGYRGSYIHGCLLNQALRNIPGSRDYLLTLDSDCFPVADGWLEELIGMLEGGAAVSGILFPWQPIPDGIIKANIERRIREKHCWNNTHVACQLTKISFIFDHNVDYTADDDTGFMVPLTAHRLGLPVVGYKVSRCGRPNAGLQFDAEFNRHVGMVFGDRIYHHGGATQTLTGYKIDRNDIFSESCARVITEKGAEFLLDDVNSYRFKFDREEEVADFKMGIMYREMVKYLQTNDRLFNP
jgi:hypothetical protein